MVDRVLQGLEEFSGAYIDDIIVFSKLWTDHVRHLQAVLGRLQLAGLTVKTSKCHFGVTACSYLGFGGLVKPEPSKVQAVLNFPTPTDKTGVRAFLGLTGFLPHWYFLLQVCLHIFHPSYHLLMVIWVELSQHVYVEHPVTLTTIMHIHTVIHLTHCFYHFIWPLPLCQ